MPDDSYSVLFMRDDADVRTFRVSPRRLKLLLWFSGVLAAVVIVCLAVGLRSYVGYRGLLKQRRELELRLADAQVNLERLGNLRKIEQEAAPAGKGAGAKTAPAARAPETAGSAVRAFHRVDTGAIAVDNLRIQVQGGALNVGFDLNNRTQRAAAGSIALLLLRSDGVLAELDAEPASDLTYQISRFKRIGVAARLPKGLGRRDALGLRVEIKNASGEVILGQTYALGG